MDFYQKVDKAEKLIKTRLDFVNSNYCLPMIAFGLMLAVFGYYNVSILISATSTIVSITSIILGSIEHYYRMEGYDLFNELQCESFVEHDREETTRRAKRLMKMLEITNHL